jgi:hypothetical protein
VAAFAGLPSMKVYLPSGFSQTKPLESKDYAKSKKRRLKAAASGLEYKQASFKTRKERFASRL